jgi:hypothetical protein
MSVSLPDYETASLSCLRECRRSEDQDAERYAKSFHAFTSLGRENDSPQFAQNRPPDEYLPQAEHRIGAGAPGDVACWTITRAGCSCLSAHANATTHPTRVHPRNRLTAKIAPLSCFFQAIIAGRKYANKNRNTTVKADTSGVLFMGPYIAPAAVKKQAPFGGAKETRKPCPFWAV